MPDGARRGGHPDRSLGGETVIAVRPRSVARLVEVVGELLGSPVRCRRAETLDLLTDAAVQEPALPLEELHEDGLAREGMPERVRLIPAGVRLLSHELGVDRGFDRVEERRLVQAADRPEDLEVEALPDDRGDLHRLPCARLEAEEPLLHRVTDRRRDRELGDRLRAMPRAVAVLELALFDKSAEDPLHAG